MLAVYAPGDGSGQVIIEGSGQGGRDIYIVCDCCGPCMCGLYPVAFGWLKRRALAGPDIDACRLRERRAQPAGRARLERGVKEFRSDLGIYDAADAAEQLDYASERKPKRQCVD